MVQVLPAVPSFGSQVIDTITRGVQQGVKAKYDRDKKIAVNRPQAQKALYSIFKQYKADPAYSPEMRQRAETLAQNYVNKGYDPYQSAFSAYEDMVAGFPEKGSKQKGKTKAEQIANEAQESPQQEQGAGPLQSILNTPVTEAIKPIHKFVTRPLASITEMPLEKLKEAAKNKPEEYLKKTREDLAVKNAGRPEDNILQKIIGATKIPQLAAFIQGLDPTGIANRVGEYVNESGTSILPKRTQLTDLGLKAAELGGELTKDYGLFKGAGKAKTIPGKVSAAAGLFGGEKALKTAVSEGRSPTVGEVGSAAAFGAGGELVGPVFKTLANFVRKIPKAYDSIKTAIKGSEGIVTEEKILTEAAKNIEGRGVSVINAVEGDPKALNELQKETIKVADTFHQAEKYNLKELEKIRTEKATKLAESPLEEYYAPKKEVTHRPETIAKEAERIKPLNVVVKQNERRLQNLQYQILSAQNSLRESGELLSLAERERIQSVIDSNKLQHQKALNEIRSAEFEIKYGHPPKTTDQIQEQIKKSFDEIRAGINDPTASKIEKLKKALEQNRKAVETAEKLIARGELPGPPVFDEFIKIKKEYVKAYDELIEELKDFIKGNKGVKSESQKVANAQELAKLIGQTRDQAKASIVNQTDKRKALKMLEGPSGALWKNLLKDVRKDVDAFQKEWIKTNKLLTPLETKTGELAHKAVKETPHEAKALKQAEEPLKDAVKEVGNKLNKGTATEKDAVKMTSELTKWLGKLSRIPGALTRGTVTGALQGLLEEYADIKLPVGLIGALLPGSFSGRAASYGSSALAHKFVNEFFIEKEAQELRKVSNTPEFNKRRNELEKRYSAEKVNKILKKVD